MGVSERLVQESDWKLGIKDTAPTRKERDRPDKRRAARQQQAIHESLKTFAIVIARLIQMDWLSITAALRVRMNDNG